MLRKSLLLGVLVLIITGCSNMKLQDFADKKPEFKLEEYFLGKTTASGLFIDLFGQVNRGNGRNSTRRCFHP